jgi:excisionase family DNA binding protein
MRETGYLTTREAAEKLGVTVGRVQQFVAEGRLPSVKAGRDRFILESDLALVSERKTGRPPKPKEEKEWQESKKRGGKK